ncbi:MAG: hypothetical protein ACI9MB_000065, partial [Verrucomicrobiales bacterium]
WRSVISFRGRTANSGRILFMMKNDPESAFIYAPEGIEGLSYNSGNCGHLLGDWYWMKED